MREGQLARKSTLIFIPDSVSLLAEIEGLVDSLPWVDAHVPLHPFNLNGQVYFLNAGKNTNYFIPGKLVDCKGKFSSVFFKLSAYYNKVIGSFNVDLRKTLLWGQNRFETCWVFYTPRSKLFSRLEDVKASFLVESYKKPKVRKQWQIAKKES